MAQTKEEKNAKNREYMVAYYAKNKSKVLECAKKYYELNKDKKSDYDKKRREANKEKIAEYKKNYAIKNKEAISKKRKKYREQNKEKIDAAIKRCKTQNREKYNSIMRRYIRTPKGAAGKAAVSEKRRAAKKSATIGDLTAIYNWIASWKSLEKAQCRWCNDFFSPNECHIDHIVPLSKGGAHCLTNLAIACAKCNLSKGCKLPADWLASKGS
jgi:5-methylcytosine-specific restriction endonuclease McrA